LKAALRRMIGVGEDVQGGSEKRVEGEPAWEDLSARSRLEEV
jgi:hypothetical protein